MGHDGDFWQNVVNRRRKWELLWHSCLESPMSSMKKQKDMTQKGELCRLAGAQYATGVKWTNNSRRNEETEPKWKQCPVMHMPIGERKVWCCKEMLNELPVWFPCMRQGAQGWCAQGQPWGMGWGGVQNGWQMYTCGWFLLMYGNSHYNV